MMQNAKTAEPTFVQVVQRLSPGGIEVMVLEMHRLRRDKVRSYIVSLEGEKAELIKAWPRLAQFADAIYCLNKGEGFTFGTARALSRLLKQLGATAVHSHHIGPLIYGGLAARMAGVSHWVHTEHDAWHLDQPKHRWLESAAVHLLRPTVVADSYGVAKALTDAIGIQPRRIIPNGIDTNTYCIGDKTTARQQLGISHQGRLVGSAGRMVPVKGQHILIEALRYLPIDVHLALAGDGPERGALEQQSQTLGLHERVHFLGHVDAMVTFYQALDVFCLSSFKEGMPLAPLEAQACGVVTLLPRIGGCAECLCPVTGRLVEVGAPAALALALNELLSQPATVSPRAFVEHQANAATMTDAYTQLCLSA